MKTIILKVKDNINEKFLCLLNNFNKEEVTILDQIEFKNDDDYLKSIEGMEQSIIDALNQPNESFVTEDKLEW